MLVVKVAVPYAEAFLGLAKANNSLSEARKDMDVIFSLISESGELKKFLSNPFTKRDIKKRVLKEALADQVNESTLTFLMLIIDRNRITFLDSIAYKFLELARNEIKLEIAKVRSTVRLSSEQQRDIAEKLKLITGARRIQFALKIDPSLIGGFTIEIGSKLIDTSIRGELKKISKLLGAS